MPNRASKPKDSKPDVSNELRHEILKVVASNPKPMRPPVLLKEVCRTRCKPDESEVRATIWSLLDEGKLELSSELRIKKAG